MFVKIITTQHNQQHTHYCNQKVQKDTIDLLTNNNHVINSIELINSKDIYIKFNKPSKKHFRRNFWY